MSLQPVPPPLRDALPENQSGGKAVELPPISSTRLPSPRSEGPLWWRILGLVKAVRPPQWIKNAFVLAPVVFAKEAFEKRLLVHTFSAFAIFCLLAGAVYIINDIADVESDRLHPIKRYRPVASGRVPIPVAQGFSIALVLCSLGWAATLRLEFLLVTLCYFLLNLAYSFKLKHVAYLDVACIAAGFVLRVVGGGYAAYVDVSGYLVLCTALLALFLGFGKRRHELSVAAGKASLQRAALESYTPEGLNLALILTGASTVIIYLIYTLDHRTRVFFRTDYLWISTGFVIGGLLRFLNLVQNRPKAESPTQEILRDGPFVAIVLLWVALVMWVVYNLGPI